MTTKAKKRTTHAAHQRALRQSERLLRALLEHSYDAIVLTTADGKTTYASPSIKRVIGYTPEEYIGLNGAELMHPDDLEDGTAFFQHILQQPGLTLPPYYTRFRHKDGSWRWIEYTATNLLTDPSIDSIVFNFRDLTERKHAEEAQRLLAAIVTSSEDAIVSKTLEGIITTWNASAEHLFGYTAAEAIGQHITLIIPPELRKEEEDIIEHMRKGQRIEHFETVRLRKDGKRIAVSLSISPVRDRQGKVIGAAKIARDMTVRKQLEDELRRSKQQLEVIFENIADGISVQDAEGNVIYMNEAGAKLCGYASAAEVLGTADFQALRAYTLQRFDIRDEQDNPFPLSELPGSRALRGELNPQAIVQYYDRVSRTRRWSVVKARSILDEADRVQLTVTIFSDITASYEAERRKDEFISMASHELKTPLTSLKGFTQLLERRLSKQGDDQALMYLAKMDRQLNRLTNLITELLDISRIQTGKLVFHDEVFDLCALVQETGDNLQQTTQTHHLCLESTEPLQVVGDRDRIGQVLINLITNAIKYSPQADKVIVAITHDQNNALVSVQDFGIGIAKEHHKHIFERFYQVTDPQENTYPGLGIGLYIAHEIITRHGGHIWVQSTKGQGATFYVSLPLKNEGGSGEEAIENGIESLAKRSVSDERGTGEETGKSKKPS